MANQINLDRSQRVDITCKRGDTFNLNLELKDSEGNPLRLGEDQESISPAVSALSEKYYYTLEVREADTDDALASSPADNGYLLRINGTVSTTSIGLVTFSATHEEMGAARDTSGDDLVADSDTTGLSAGLYVYDIQQKIVDLGNDSATGGTGPAADEISSIETLLYGTFKVVEDVTVNY